LKTQILKMYKNYKFLNLYLVIVTLHVAGVLYLKISKLIVKYLFNIVRKTNRLIRYRKNALFQAHSSNIHEMGPRHSWIFPGVSGLFSSLTTDAW